MLVVTAETLQVAAAVAVLLLLFWAVGRQLWSCAVQYVWFVVQFSVTYTLFAWFGPPVQLLHQATRWLTVQIEQVQQHNDL